MNQKELLENWLIRAKTVENAHFEFCGKYKRKHYIWGGLLITTSTLGSAITAIVEQGSEETMHLWVFSIRVALALFVPLCAAIVTFLKYESRSERHHDAAARFSSLKRKLSVLLARLEDGAKIELKFEIEKISLEWDKLTMHMPSIPKSKTNWYKEIQQTKKILEKSRKAEV